MTDEDDPVTAEYDVYITPSLKEQVQLLQYPNRRRDQPYSAQGRARPEVMRIKPKSGFLELDIGMNTEANFNKFQGLKWGDAMESAKTLQNDSATYGPAAGFSVPRTKPGTRNQLKDKAERDIEILNDMATFKQAVAQNKAFRVQTLGGKTNRCDVCTDGAQPVYFAGAFRGSELHLTRVNGTVQMRPHFHHIDAEDQRNRTAASRVTTADSEANRPAAPARALTQSYKDLNDDKDKDAPERRMRQLLQDAEEENWSTLQYVDEQEDLAYDTFNQCMFVEHPSTAQTLRCEWNEEQYLNHISPARHGTHTRRKKRHRKKDAIDVDAGGSHDEHD